LAATYHRVGVRLDGDAFFDLLVERIATLG
jgi:hypothetical protein